MVKALVRRNSNLTQLADKEGRVPLGISALEASMHKEIVWFLAKYTTDDGPSHPFSITNMIGPILCLTSAGHHDITLYLVERYPHLITTKSGGFSILDVLVRRESHFPSGTRLGVLEALIYKCIPVDLNYTPTDKNSDLGRRCLTRLLWNAVKYVAPIIKRIHELKLRHVGAVQLAKRCCMAISDMNTTEITHFFQDSSLLYHATTMGISEVVKLCILFFPELIWISHDGETLATHAVKFRQERTLRLFLNVKSTNKLSLVPAPTQKESEDMILAVANSVADLSILTDVAGAAFQIQSELKWFEAVESWIIPDARTFINDSKKYWRIFVEEHEELRKNGEKWMKDTANSCMLVSTLIGTVLFAAAFTIPGGNNGTTGVPLLLGQDSLLLFVISDGLGLFSSVAAILLFLAILTSRYETQDFLELLPKKIIFGLCFLFLSLAFMLATFAATLTIVLNERLEWVVIPVTLLASLPVALFVVLQLPLLSLMVKSTYGRSIFRVESIWMSQIY